MNRRPLRSLGPLVAALLVGCSTAPASPSPVPVSPAASPTVTSSAPPATSGPVVSPSATAGSPLGAPFEVLPAEPPPGFAGSIACDGEIGPFDPVAVIQRAATGTSEEAPEGAIELVDFAGASPRTVCTFEQGPLQPFTIRLIDPRHLVVEYGDENGDRIAIVDLPDVRYRWFQLPHGSEWGPELLTVALGPARVVWKDVHTDDSDTDAIHVTSASEDAVVATLPDRNQGRCGDVDDSRQAAFAPDGSHLYVLDQPYARNNSLVVFDGTEAKLSIPAPAKDWGDGAWPAMAVWSPISESLLFRQKGDVWQWSPTGGRQRFLAGVSWSRPTFSADGRYLAYVVAHADDTSDLYVIETLGDGKPRKVGANATDLAFLDAHHLWYVRTGFTGCAGPSEPTHVVLDVDDGTDTASDIVQVISTWPATSSNH